MLTFQVSLKFYSTPFQTLKPLSSLRPPKAPKIPKTLNAPKAPKIPKALPIFHRLILSTYPDGLKRNR